jgi:hypothetical protein
MKTAENLTEKQIEAINAVQKLNNEFHDKFGWSSPDLPMLSITICSYMFFISLNSLEQEIKLFNSEQDDRIYYEKSDKNEAFYSYIKRKFREEKSKLNKIKL